MRFKCLDRGVMNLCVRASHASERAFTRLGWPWVRQTFFAHARFLACAHLFAKFPFTPPTPTPPPRHNPVQIGPCPLLPPWPTAIPFNCLLSRSTDMHTPITPSFSVRRCPSAHRSIFGSPHHIPFACVRSCNSPSFHAARVGCARSGSPSNWPAAGQHSCRNSSDHNRAPYGYLHKHMWACASAHTTYTLTALEHPVQEHAKYTEQLSPPLPHSKTPPPFNSPNHKPTHTSCWLKYFTVLQQFFNTILLLIIIHCNHIII